LQDEITLTLRLGKIARYAPDLLHARFVFADNLIARVCKLPIHRFKFSVNVSKLAPEEICLGASLSACTLELLSGVRV
jgi:hypothetical protein